MEGQAMLQYLAKKYDGGMYSSNLSLHDGGLLTERSEQKFSFTDEAEQSVCEQWIGFAQSHLGPYSAEAVL